MSEKTKQTDQQQKQRTDQQQEQQTEQIETIAKSEYDKVLAELEEVKAKLPRELSEEEKALQQKQQELFVKEVNLTLKENGLDKFASVVKVENEEELKEVVKTLKKIVNELKIEMGYVPADHKQMTAYEQAKKQGDTKTMIKALFGMK